jgi:hypothetical protein
MDAAASVFRCPHHTYGSATRTSWQRTDVCTCKLHRAASRHADHVTRTACTNTQDGDDGVDDKIDALTSFFADLDVKDPSTPAAAIVASWAADAAVASSEAEAEQRRQREEKAAEAERLLRADAEAMAAAVAAAGRC